MLAAVAVTKSRRRLRCICAFAYSSREGSCSNHSDPARGCNSSRTWIWFAWRNHLIDAYGMRAGSLHLELSARSRVRHWVRRATSRICSVARDARAAAIDAIAAAHSSAHRRDRHDRSTSSTISTPQSVVVDRGLGTARAPHSAGLPQWLQPLLRVSRVAVRWPGPQGKEAEGATRSRPPSRKVCGSVDDCKEIVYRKEVEANLNVCTKCGYHFR